MKTCTTCKQSKVEDEFYKDSRRVDGLKSQCKKCHCLTSIISRNLETHRDYNREWHRRSKYHTRPEVRERDLLRSRVRNKSVEARARHLANVAVRLGFLQRPSACPKCERSDLGIHAHHADHKKPLEVDWLCSECHGLLSRKQVAKTSNVPPHH